MHICTCLIPSDSSGPGRCQLRSSGHANARKRLTSSSLSDTCPSFPPAPGLPPCPVLAGGRRQRYDPAHHAPEQPPRQAALRQKQPVMAALPTNRPPVFHQPLLQACRRLVADRIWQHQPPPETPRVGLRQPQGCGRRRRCFDHRHSERRDRARKVGLLETGCPEELAGSLGRVTPDAWK